jgi:hypothetical protein
MVYQWVLVYSSGAASVSMRMPSWWISVLQTGHSLPAQRETKILPIWKIRVSFFTPFIEWNQNERQQQAIDKIDRSQHEDLNH